MYAPQGLPAVSFSVLASSVIIVAARAGLLTPCVVPALGLVQKQLMFEYPVLCCEQVAFITLSGLAAGHFIFSLSGFSFV